MQQVKGTRNITEITNYSDSTILHSFNRLLGKLDLRYINKLLNSSKSRGISASNVFQTVFMFRFLDFSNIYQLMQHGISKELRYEKDVLYEFVKNTRIDWRNIVYLFFRQVMGLVSSNTDGSSVRSVRYFIVDDSLLEKSGKKIEMIGKVFDHCLHSYMLGIKMLTLGVWEGKNFMPLDFSFHNEPGKNGKRGMKDKELKTQFTKHRDEDTKSFKRIQEVAVDKIENCIKMIGRAVKKGVSADYVLADSWFICEKFIVGIKSLKGADLNIIGLMKTNRKIILNGKTFMANKIPEINLKCIKTSTKLKCQYIKQTIEYKGIPMCAYWIRMKGQTTWKMLISTDLELTFTSAMKHYQVRWSIEVFFKDCKQKLHLNGCKSTDLDAHIATVSIVFMNYMILAIKKRFDDYEPLGGLFNDVKEIILEEILIKKIWKIFIELYIEIFSMLGVEWDIFIKKLIENHDEINKIILNQFNSFFKLNGNAA